MRTRLRAAITKELLLEPFTLFLSTALRLSLSLLLGHVLLEVVSVCRQQPPNFLLLAKSFFKAFGEL